MEDQYDESQILITLIKSGTHNLAAVKVNKDMLFP